MGICCILLLIFFLLLTERDAQNIILTLSLFASASFKILPGINRITNYLQKIKLASANIMNISTEMNNYRRFNKMNINQNQIKLENHLNFKNVSYLYDEKNIIFKI